jgi:hypothetical protein
MEKEFGVLAAALARASAASGGTKWEWRQSTSWRTDMRILRRVVAIAAMGAGAAVLIAPTSAASLGRASMPNTVAQYFGYGYGAGHHAPIVRTPGMHPERVPRNVRVPRYAGPLYPAPYEAVRCYGEACYGGVEPVPAYPPANAPTPADAIVPTPAVAPSPGPAPEADHQAWGRPF